MPGKSTVTVHADRETHPSRAVAPPIVDGSVTTTQPASDVPPERLK